MSGPKNVNLIVIDAVKIDGEHYAVGDVLTNVEPELAKELTGAGRTRLATEDEVARATKKRRASAEG
ncbi:MAG: hypothetical protein N2688_00430 [Burkholderiaceae bacterium]|jgi:hypothetical protein|nr:hypothetical protein [Burkholderiaceae bacterium]